MTTRLFLFSLIAGFTLNLNAQVTVPNRGCGSDVLPQQFETWLQSVTPVTPVNPGKNGQSQAMSVFNIPVVVHVIHNNEALNNASATSGGNLNAAQIQNQINILNKDYNGTNPDTASIPAVFKPLLGKFQFNFCLAVVNPTGAVMAEPGIDRVNAVGMGWGAPPYSRTFIDASIKAVTIWDPNRYMNMWVCGISGGILGYATFPNPGTSGLSGLTGAFGTLSSDGLVMQNTSFGSIGTAATGGPYNLGRTATHEIGHWLGLRHIWGDNGQCGATDFCNDTPPQQGGTSSPAGANYGCPTFPLHANACTLSSQTNTNGDMFMNYMDYTDDACMFMFTNDQKNRAQLIMTNSPMRSTLLTSTVCNLPTVTNDIGILYVLSPTYSQVVNCNSLFPLVNVYNFGTNTITTATYSYNIDGVNTQSFNWTGSLAPGGSLTVVFPILNTSNGTHAFNVGVYAPNGAVDPNMVNNTNNQFFLMTNSFTFSVTPSTSICPGTTASLTASGTATGYTWNPGNIAAASINVSPASTTIYTVSGGNGTCVNTQTVMVTVGSLALSVNASTTTLCGPGLVNLSSPNSLTSYTWNTGGNGPIETVNPAITTSFTLTGSDGVCTGTAVITITVSAIPIVAIGVSPVASICAGGSATLMASGASSYLWGTGETTNSIVVSPSSTTIYTVTGMDLACASAQTTTVIVGGGSISVSITATPASICAGSSATLTASGATSYTWNTGSNANSIIVNPTTTSVYSFDGSNGSCIGNASATINVISSPTLNVTVSPSNTVCIGKTVTLTAGGSYTAYSWANPISTNPVIVVTPTATTAYTLTGLGGAPGCGSSNTVVTLYVTSNPISIITTGNSTCANPCSGMINAASTGGTAPYTYSISGSTCTTMPCASLCPALYTMYTHDANGCNSTNIFSIANSASSFMASVTSTIASCVTCANGKLKANVYYGTGPYTYAWSPAGGNAAVAADLAPGCYTVVVTDITGCTTYASGCVDGVGTGLNTNSQSISFLVYPNPAKNNVTIEYTGASFDYTVYNHLGQLILVQKNNRGPALVNTGDFAAGIYLIEIDNGKNKSRKKLIIE